jgi:Cysteine-rich CWC
MKQCGRCSANFTCSHSDGCWCAEVGLTLAQLVWVKQQLAGCLCPDCLVWVKENVALDDGRPETKI